MTTPLDKIRKELEEISEFPWKWMDWETEEDHRTKLNNFLFIESSPQRISAMLSVIEKAKEVAEFYVDKDNWDTDSITPTIWDDGDVDLGRKAQSLLEAINDLEEKL